MSVEALLGTDAVFASDLHALRPQPGQVDAAANMRALLAGRPIVASHRGPEDTRVQDAYSLRCAPAVSGAARDTARSRPADRGARTGAAIDNPVVTLDGRVESNGNFHGAPVGYVLDFLAIAAADVASMSERRTDRMLDAGPQPRTAAVPRRRPWRRLGPHDRPVHAGGHRLGDEAARRASVGRLDPQSRRCRRTTCRWAGRLARKLRRAIDGLTRVLAIEILTAARGLDLRAPLQPGAATGAVLADASRAVVAGPGPDRYLRPRSRLPSSSCAAARCWLPPNR